jgi:predicted transcriptional regulator
MKRRCSKFARDARGIARDRDVQSWHFHQIHAGVAELNEGRSVPHATVATWLRSWGKRDERKAPRA